MKYAVGILTFLALVSVLPEMAAMTGTAVGGQALSFGHSLRSSMAWLSRVASHTPQPVWLVGLGILLIGLSWLVRRRMSRSASQSST